MKKNYLKIIKVLGKEKVLLDEPLARYTTFKIGGPADFFFEARTEDEIRKVAQVARQLKIPYFVLGGGSNLLVSDKGFRGLIIKISSANLADQISNCQIVAEAGVPLSEVVEAAAKHSLSGLEFAVGIPGTLGGAIVGNAGAWQQTIGEKMVKAKILTNDGQVRWLPQKDCQFGYRESRFQKTGEIVLAARLKLEPGERKEIGKRMEEYRQKRKTQPQEPSCGSVFVNPKPESAASLIEECGLKGKRIGQAQISPQHVNFIVNLGGAKSSDVLKLISLAKKEVREKFGINLVEEIKMVGEF